MKTEVVYDKLEDLQAKVEYYGGGITTLLNNSLLDAGSVVKSVQRGTYKATEYNITEDIQIAQVNASKCLLLLEVTSKSTFTGYHSATLSNDKIAVTFHSLGVEYLVQWQVIEFY